MNGHVPLLHDSAAELARKWAEYRFTRNAHMLTVMLQLSNGKVPEVDGRRVLDNLAEAGTSVLFASAHWAAYQALPATIASLGYRTAYFIDGPMQALR